MKEQNEIQGDLRDERLAIQAADAFRTKEDTDDWYQTLHEEELPLRGRENRLCDGCNMPIRVKRNGDTWLCIDCQ